MGVSPARGPIAANPRGESFRLHADAQFFYGHASCRMLVMFELTSQEHHVLSPMPYDMVYVCWVSGKTPTRCLPVLYRLARRLPKLSFKTLKPCDTRVLEGFVRLGVG